MRRQRSAARSSALHAALLFFGLHAAPLPAQDVVSHEAELESGRSHYIANCARCHGVNGGGGEGPPLARSTLPRAPDDAALVRIMRTGISGSAMGSTWWLSRESLEQIALFVRSLAPASADEAETLRGDPSRGRTVFEAEGCDRCHTVRGFGTGRGPDLTTVGSRRGASYLREAIVDPPAALPRGLTAMPSDFVDYLVVRAVDRDGRAVRGVRLNEDTYTIQIKDARGVIRTFYKPDLQSLDREFDRSLMQSYADRLSEEDLDDLIAYLATLTGSELRGIS
ncbi:MAG: c-type cytochrome [Gemmatimonadota bacterium]|nr:c-type cytochrome [Gemmatimonadota bacterium]